MAFATPKRVTFNKEVSKWSQGSTTPTISRLSQIENKRESVSSTCSTSSKLNIKSNNLNKLTTNNENAITVAIRVRPLNEKENESGYYNAIRVDNSNKEITLYDKPNNKQHKFTCDFVITDQLSSNNSESMSNLDSQQQYVYESIGKSLLEKSFEGYNVSIFAYGQTGSGKTYSMIGSNNQLGLIPRLLDDLFDKKSERDKIVSSTHLEISYYEIYNEKIYDLLPSDGMNTANSKDIKLNTNGKHLQIREDPKTGPYIVDLSTLGVNSAKDAKQWLDIGNKRRATACTNMNQKSSRSHSVLQINLTQILKHNNEQDIENTIPNKNQSKSHSEYLQIFSSRINLIDLAGSERINSAFDPNTNFTSSNNSNKNATTRFRESTCINKSLLTLGKIICLLSERQNAATISNSNNNNNNNNNNSNNAMINAASLATINGYLPYRESTLTWLLKDSLGGNAKTAMLATVNASSCYIDETLCTLRYAAKTASIKNAVEMNHNFRQKYVNEFGEVTEISLAIAPLKHIHDVQLETALKRMETEWKDKLEEAERIKQKEIKDLEKSLIVFYENETNVQNCCLINLNEDPSFSEKLIYKLKSNTTVGGDKNMVDIHLTGPLIGPIHSKISSNGSLEYFIEQLDKNCVTYLNGEVIEADKKYPLNHCDIIIFGGSHFFRFNNPSSTSNRTIKSNQFKDYQFAKAELERKQNELIQKKVNEALNKYKQDDDIKLKQLKQKYEENLESIKSDLEKEKNARKLEVEQIKTESNKKLKQYQKKIMIESKINELEHDQAKINNECNKQEHDLLLLKTPNNNSKMLLNKILLSESSKKTDQTEIIQSHASSNGIFAISLCVTEANKICNTLCFDYEFKRYEINKQQAICVIDKKLKLITLWNLETFEFKLNMLRDIYLKYVEENSGNNNEISISSTSSTDSQMVTDSMDEWQKLDEFEKNDEIFSPRIIENAIGSNNKDSSNPNCKRRLSMLSNNNSSTNLNKKLASTTSLLPSTTCLSKSIDNLSLKSSTDQLDSVGINKKKLIIQNANQTPQIIRTPLISSSCLNLKTKSFDYLGSNNNAINLNVGNSLLFATCRDALNDELQIEDSTFSSEDEKENEMEDDAKFLKSTTDDFYLKSYAKLIYTLNKLVDTQLTDNHSENQISSNNLNKPLYALKIFQYYTELTSFEPNYLLINLTNPNCFKDIKKLYIKIKKGLNLLRDNIKCLYQSVENNLESMTREKHNLIMNQLLKVIHMHGEFMLLNCSNTFINRATFCLTMIDNKFLIEYIKGVEEQFFIFLANKKSHLDQNHPLITQYMKYIQDFCIFKNKSLFNNNKLSQDSLIDYSNYLYQTHYRLNSSIKLIDSLKKVQDEKIINKINEKMLEYVYNILTDTLAINSLDVEDSDGEEPIDSSKPLELNWNEIFINACQNIKSNYVTKSK